MRAMRSFIWQGTDRHGRNRMGLAPARSQRQLQQRLRHQGVITTRALSLPDWFDRLINPARPRLREQDITRILQRMAALIDAGIPLAQALEMLAAEERHGAGRRLLESLAEGIASGSDLSAVLAEWPSCFDELARGLIAAGEQSGELPALLRRIVDHRQRLAQTRQRLRRALFYPGLVLAVALLVTAALLIFVIPRFEAMFSDLDAPLPAFTQSVIDLSRWFRTGGGTLVPMLTGLLPLLWGFARYLPRLHHLRDRLRVRLPIYGGVHRRALLCRFARTLALLLRADVPATEALSAVARALDNHHYQRLVTRMVHELRAGRSMADAIARSEGFSPALAQVAAVGESTGRLPALLDELAAAEEGELERRVSALTSSIEPLMMALLGLLVGALVFAMYLPVFRMGAVF
ncbi:type II secretion system F family protein [Spiribacter pallidus]